MTRVAILKSRLSKSGGLEKYTRRTAEALSERGCEVAVLTTGEGGVDLSFPVISLGKVSPLSVKHMLDFDRWSQQWLKENRCDRVLGMDRNSFQTHYRAGSGVHKAFLARRSAVEGWGKSLSFRLDPLHRLTLKFERKTYEGEALQGLITNSHMVKEEVLANYSTDPGKIHVIHNGVEWKELAAPFSAWKDEAPQIKKELGLDPSAHQFLFIGHDYKRKGLLPLLEAFPKGEGQLSIIGRARDLRFWKDVVSNHGLEKQVFFFGPQSDTKPFLKMADTLVLPTFYDPCANVTLEALAMGLFVITSPDNGAKELLTPETGRVAAAEELSSVLREAMGRPKAERADSIRKSVAHLDFPNQLNQLIDVVLSHPTC